MESTDIVAFSPRLVQMKVMRLTESFLKNPLVLQISDQRMSYQPEAFTYWIWSCSLSRPLPSALSTQSVTTSDRGLVNVTSTSTGLCTTAGPRTYREKTFCSATPLVSCLPDAFLLSFPLQTTYPFRITQTGRSQELVHVHIFGQQSSALNEASSVAKNQRTAVESTI